MSSLSKGSIGALLVVAALLQAAVFLIRPATTYQALELGVSPAALGLIGGAFAVVPLVLAIPAGGFADRWGAMPVMLAGGALTVAAPLLLIFFGSTLPGLLAGTAVLGAGHLGCVVGQQSLVANSARAGGLDALFGYYTFAVSLGQALGPAMIALVGSGDVQPDTTAMLQIAVGLCVAMCLVTFMIRPVRESVARGAGPRSGRAWQLLRTPGVARAIATSALIVAAVDLTIVYLPALGAERGYTSAVVGLLLTLRAVFSMLSRLFLGRLSGSVGRARLMLISIAVSAATLMLFAAPMPVWLLCVVASLLGLGLGIGQPITMSWVSEQAPLEQRGRALALRLAGNRLSQIVVPAAVGSVAAGFGAGAVLFAMGGIIASTLGLLRGVRLDGD